MPDHIETVLFDIGGTLRRSVKKTETEKIEGVRHIAALLGADESPEKFAELLTRRMEDYSRWARDTLIELNEADQWTKWLLPDYPGEKISTLALQLNQLWRAATGTRTFFNETQEIVLELFRRGYKLGIVSNTVSSTEIPQALEEMQISHCFETVILSCVEGLRKPGAAIFQRALDELQISPQQVAYIGDSPSRDVFGARNAGISKTVIIRLKEPFDLGPLSAELIPDHLIHSHNQILVLFPPLVKTGVDRG